MEKRFLLAAVLSFLVLFLWSALFPKQHPIVNKAVITQVLLPNVTIPNSPPAGPFRSLSWESSEIKFIENQAAIREVVFKKYQSSSFPLYFGLGLEDPALIFKPTIFSPEQVEFVAENKEQKVIKRFKFSNSNYAIDLELEVFNLTNVPLTASLPITLGVLNFKSPEKARFQAVTVYSQEKILHTSGRKDESWQRVKFIGVRDQYFCAVLDPIEENYSAWVKKINPQESKVGVTMQDLTILPGQRHIQRFKVYIGPQDMKMLGAICPDWTFIMHYGTFNFIAHLLFQLLQLLQSFSHNWGVSIIILSFIIYILLFPLSLKQMRSMKEMQKLQPKIEALRTTYKDNPQRLNKEIMELYREHKVNPLGGCLPLILQMPIFFSLYQLLSRTVFLKGASFLWIKDLSAPDRLFLLSVSIPLIGNELNILPILMMLIMFFQQKFTMPSASTASSDQQRIMSILFPVMFGVIFYHMPAGLVLYWFVNSLLMFLYQLKINQPTATPA